MVPDKNFITWTNNELIRKEAEFHGNSPFAWNNKVWITGVIESEPEVSHIGKYESFLKVVVSVKRLSGVNDFVVVIIPENYICIYKGKTLKGLNVEIGGAFRSHKVVNQYGERYTEFFVFARYFKILWNKELSDIDTNVNIIYLEGTLIKSPIYRVTPFGRAITDVMLCVNRKIEHIKDYIPCIAWGHTAFYLGNMRVGTNIKLYGMVQSRKYFKVLNEEKNLVEERTAYEVSVLKVDIAD